jgi:hypothetical protein
MSGAGGVQGGIPVAAHLMRATAAASSPTSITLADRAEMLANLVPGSLATTLKYRLREGDAAGFDQILLDRMVARQGPQYFFASADAAAYVQFAANDTYPDTSNLVASINAEKDAADKILQHLFPQQVDSETYTVQLGTTIDWGTAPAGQDSNFLHSLNRQNFWPQLAEAYQLTGDRRYARELCAELQTWYVQNAPLKNPDAWPDKSPRWWLLDAADRVSQWTRAYFLMLGTKGLTPEANTLFLSGLLRHADFLSRVTPRSAASNWTTLHAAALGQLGTLFPEFARSANWRAQGRSLMNACLDRQFFPDGGHVEQSPAYAASAVDAMLDDFRLDAINGGTGWTRKARLRLTAAVEAFYELAQGVRKLPGLSDTYENFPAGALIARAGVVLGDSRYNVAPPKLEELWLVGPDAVTARRAQPVWAGLGDRGPAYALPDAGYYTLRGQSVTHAGTPDYQVQNSQLIFDAGPSGGTHGHADLFNIELSYLGNTQIADPGPWAYDNSAQRTSALSTPAHNTISIDGLNHATVDVPHSPLVSVDKFEVGADYAVVSARHYAYSYLPGQPVVARTVWMDQRDPFSSPVIIVDWASSSTVHTYTTSLTVPAPVSGVILQDSGALVGNTPLIIQPILAPGQTARIDPAFVTASPPPTRPIDATRWSVSQTGKSAVFITVLSPNTVSLVEPIRRGRPIQVLLTGSQPDRIVTFDPPDLAPPVPTGAGPKPASNFPAALSAQPPTPTTTLRSRVTLADYRTVFSVGAPIGLGVTSDLDSEPPQLW